MARDPAPPTPEEIRQRCLKIQAGWSDAERERRRVPRRGRACYQLAFDSEGGLVFRVTRELRAGAV